MTIRAVVTTEDSDEELVSPEPLLLLPEQLNMPTNLAKQQLGPLFEATKLPSIGVAFLTSNLPINKGSAIHVHMVLRRSLGVFVPKQISFAFTPLLSLFGPVLAHAI